jgi:hypothetical protein
MLLQKNLKFALKAGQADLEGAPNSLQVLAKTGRLSVNIYSTEVLYCTVIAPAATPLLPTYTGSSYRKRPETHNKRQATLHDCLSPWLLGDGDKGIEIVYGEEKIVCIGPTRASKAGQKNPLYRHEEPDEPTNEGSLSFALFESLFALIINSNQGPSLSLNTTLNRYFMHSH